MRLLITGSLTQLGDGEFASDIVYLFRICPMGQDRLGNDRVFTFNCYAKREWREAPKHSASRKDLAIKLRKRHRLLWQHYHNAMDK